MRPRKLVAGNWKMNMSVPETRRLVSTLKNRLLAFTVRADVVVCPPFPSLGTAVEAARESPIRVGAQNVHWEASGAYTGEVSTTMLEAVGVEYVIVGHSERRQLFSERDADVGRKLRRVLSGRLTPIVCVGEGLDERESGRTREVVVRQMDAALEGIAPDQAPRIVVAYEPVWAIGTGRTASPAAAQEVHVLIRERIAATLGSAPAGAVRILYGGSVKPENAASLLMSDTDIDGVLVGGASLDAQSFAAIVRSAS